MKLIVQKKKSDKTFIVEIPARADLAYMNRGDKFEVNIYEGDILIKKTMACFLADYRSLLIDNTVVRVKKHIFPQRHDRYRIGVKLSGIVTQNTISVKVFRPVEPKKVLNTHVSGDIKSPMTGKLIAIHVQEGQAVKEGDLLAFIEAMKMENRIIAEYDGIVKNIKAKIGTNISPKDVILTIESKA